MPLLLTLLASLMFARGPLAGPLAIPKEATQLHVSNGWQVTVVTAIVPGTEQNRAPSFDCVYYCGKLDGSSARIVYKERGTSPAFRPLRISPDSTVTASVDSGWLLIMGPQDELGKGGQGESVDTPGLEKNERTELLHANAAGLVARPYRIDEIVPVYFLPMAEGKPVQAKAVELCQRDRYAGFQVTDRWIVWDTGSYEVATGKIRKRVAESGVITDLAIDGDLVLTRRWATVDEKAIHEIVSIDIRTGAPKVRQPVAHDTRFLTVHDGVAYV